MKKLLNTIILTFLVGLMFNVMSAFASPQMARIVVLPLDLPSDMPSYSVFPNAINMISDDLANSMSSYPEFDLTDVNRARTVIKQTGMLKPYKQFVIKYKDTYVVDYDFLDRLSSKLNCDYIVFVSGGFDTQRSILKHNLIYDLQFIWKPSIDPSVYLGTLVTVIDIKKHTKIFEKVYDKDFRMTDFENPAQYFAENIVPIKRVKKYSMQITPEITASIYMNIFPDSVKTQNMQKNLKFELVNFFTPKRKAPIQEDIPTPGDVYQSLPKDGNLTMDGQPLLPDKAIQPEADPSLKEERRQNYKKWAL